MPQLALGVGLHSLPGRADQPGSGGIGFPAALPSAGAASAVPADHGMARLHPSVIKAGIQLPPQHRAGTHAGTQGHGHQGVLPPARPGNKLTQGSGIGVIFQKGRQSPKPLRNHSAQGHMVQTQVEGVAYLPPLGINGAGRCKAHAFRPLHRDPGSLGSQAGSLGYSVGHRLASPGTGHTGLSQKFSVLLYHSGGHIGAAQVDADVIAHTLASHKSKGHSLFSQIAPRQFSPPRAVKRKPPSGALSPGVIRGTAISFTGGTSPPPLHFPLASFSVQRV